MARPHGKDRPDREIWGDGPSPGRTDEGVREQGSALTRFLDIYENSQKRWYLTPMGWQRMAP